MEPHGPCHRCHLPHRTATVWKTLSPFWGEEYEVHLQPSFHSVSIYVMDEDALRYRAGRLRGGGSSAWGLGGQWLCLPAYSTPLWTLENPHLAVLTWPLGHKWVKYFLRLFPS